MRWRRRRRQNEPMKSLDGGVCLNAMYHGVLVHVYFFPYANKVNTHVLRPSLPP